MTVCSSAFGGLARISFGPMFGPLHCLHASRTGCLGDSNDRAGRGSPPRLWGGCSYSGSSAARTAGLPRAICGALIKATVLDLCRVIVPNLDQAVFLAGCSGAQDPPGLADVRVFRYSSVRSSQSFTTGSRLVQVWACCKRGLLAWCRCADGGAA